MFFGFSAPKIGGVLVKTFSTGSFTRFFQKMGPPGGGGGILPDFTRCGTNYLQTTLLKKYPKKQLFGVQKHIVWIQRPQNRGGPHDNIFKRLIYPFFPKNGPPGGGGAFYQISPDVALTTCIQLYPKSNFLDSESIFFGFSAPKIGGSSRLFVLFIVLLALPKWHFHLANRVFFHITTFML